jgi:hypothetical protein
MKGVMIRDQNSIFKPDEDTGLHIDGSLDLIAH